MKLLQSGIFFPDGPPAFRILLPCVSCVAIIISGCAKQQQQHSDVPQQDLLNELMADLPAETESGSQTVNGRKVSFSNTQRSEFVNSSGQSANSGSTPITAVARGERLELRLRPGDRFPLIKTVEQHLIQRSEQYPATAHTKLELTLAITVDQVQNDAVLLSVRYSRVSYSHDINGNRLEYDSAIHQTGYPRDAEPYAGMVNNGFAFWLSRDNKIRELVGYREFLERCVQNVPIERRQTMLSEISNRFGDDGVANFVDDSIGLLPYDTSVDPASATRVAVGDVWTRETRLMQPAPIYLNSTYRLVTLNEQTAEIEINGRIASGESVPTPDKSMLQISGGHSMGKCTVDRVTGLPLDVTVTRFVNMLITLPGGQTVPQDKQIFTRIRSFPETRGPVVQHNPPQNGMNAGGIQQAAAFGTSPVNTASPIPTNTANPTSGQGLTPGFGAQSYPPSQNQGNSNQPSTQMPVGRAVYLN